MENISVLESKKEAMTSHEDEIRLLHIYGQESWHDDAYIVGNKEGLMALRQAIDDALKINKALTLESVSDGEGYSVKIIMDNTGWQEPFWTKLVLPYTVSYAKDSRLDVVYPWAIADWSE